MGHNPEFDGRCWRVLLLVGWPAGILHQTPGEKNHQAKEWEAVKSNLNKYWSDDLGFGISVWVCKSFFDSFFQWDLPGQCPRHRSQTRTRSTNSSHSRSEGHKRQGWSDHANRPWLWPTAWYVIACDYFTQVQQMGTWTKKMLGNTLAMLMVFWMDCTLSTLWLQHIKRTTYVKAYGQMLLFEEYNQVVCLWNVSWYPNMGRPWTHYHAWGVGWTSQPQLLDQFDHTRFQGSLVLTFQKRHWSLGIDEFQKDSTGKRILDDFGRSWILIVERWFGWVQRVNATP